MYTSHIIDLVFAALSCVWAFFMYKQGRLAEREHTDRRIAEAEAAIKARGRLCTDPVHMTQGLELNRERVHAARLAEELAVLRRVNASIVDAKAEIDEALEQRGLTLVRSPRTGKWCIVPKRDHAERVPSVGTFMCMRCNVRIRAKSGQRSHVCTDCHEAPRVTFQVKGPIRAHGVHVIRAEHAETLPSGDVRVTFVPYQR